MAMTKFERERFDELFRKGWTVDEIYKQIQKDLKQKKAEYDDVFGQMFSEGKFPGGDMGDMFGGFGKKKKK